MTLQTDMAQMRHSKRSTEVMWRDGYATLLQKRTIINNSLDCRQNDLAKRSLFSWEKQHRNKVDFTEKMFSTFPVHAYPGESHVPMTPVKFNKSFIYNNVQYTINFNIQVLQSYHDKLKNILQCHRLTN